MYAIVEKATREIMRFDFDEYGSPQLLLDDTEKDARDTLDSLTYTLIGAEPSHPVEFNNAEIVPVTLTWE